MDQKYPIQQISHTTSVTCGEIAKGTTLGTRPRSSLLWADGQSPQRHEEGNDGSVAWFRRHVAGTSSNQHVALALQLMSRLRAQGWNTDMKTLRACLVFASLGYHRRESISGLCLVHLACQGINLLNKVRQAAYGNELLVSQFRKF
ncbi:hypothetical protein B0H13DRAFT_1864922 [Mycena leptocephala]|nr:hypothetical protein B0H13DRAFT_1864922 [Mycena leptocephala]